MFNPSNRPDCIRWPTVSAKSMATTNEIPLAFPQADEQSARNDQRVGSSVDSAILLLNLESQPYTQSLGWRQY